ncbi:protein dj-1beta-like isoform X2 [Chelonus insularis]|nr:protein dj-1beta-like isoform X2 [Chelonus insularis]XP_034940083.1 protein dj-1beta-like isoform X2 [Chelonus insularis]
MAQKTAVLLLADGAEEMEAVITADILRRAGIVVTIASVSGNECVTCSREVKICADAKLQDIKNQSFDAVILPGGLGGSKALGDSKEVGELLQRQKSEGKTIAAICAAPTALKNHEIGKGSRITCYPSMKSQLADYYKYEDQAVVIDGNIISSRGPATAFAFGLAIVENLLTKEIADTVSKGMLYNEYK